MNRGWYKSAGRLYEIRVKNMENGEIADEIILHFGTSEEQDMLRTAKMIASHSNSTVRIDLICVGTEADE